MVVVLTSYGFASYPMFIEPTITWVPSGFSGYIWLDTKIVFKKKVMTCQSEVTFLRKYDIGLSIYTMSFECLGIMEN